MTKDERSKKLRLDALGITLLEHMLSLKKQTQNKPQLSLQFKGGAARLVLSTNHKG